jgi:hypothetical protein
MLRRILPLGTLALLLASTPVWAEDANPTEKNAPPKLEGTWMLAIPMPDGVEKPTLRVRERDGKLKGTLRGKAGSRRLRNFTFEGPSFSFNQVVPTPKGEMIMKFRGSLQGDRIQGVIELPFGILPFTGSRIFD